ncbi:MAG: helix-turn-helix domain-containing protein [Christensenellales bacterium]
MRISYNKLWHIMLDKKMNKQDLKRATGISTASIAKLNRGDNITTDVLVKICVALGCDITEIMELVEDNEQ